MTEGGSDQYRDDYGDRSYPPGPPDRDDNQDDAGAAPTRSFSDATPSDQQPTQSAYPPAPPPPAQPDQRRPACERRVDGPERLRQKGTGAEGYIANAGRYDDEEEERDDRTRSDTTGY